MCALLVLAVPLRGNAATITTGPQTETEIQAAWRLHAPSYAGGPYLVTPSVTAPYAPGAAQPGFLADGLRLINFARFLAGIPADVTLDAERNTDAQYGAVLLAASVFSHTPTRPGDMPADFYERGARSAASSNIGWGMANAWSFELVCLDDADAGNISRVGHRRWLLNPAMLNTGIGVAANRYTTYSFDASRPRAVNYDVVAWPCAGSFPVQFFGSAVPWSISLNPSRYDWDTSASQRVTLRRLGDGKTWTFDAFDSNASGEYFSVDFNGYGVPNCFIFRPDPSSVTYRPGDEFEVALSGGIFAHGTQEPVTISYRTRFVSLFPRDEFEPDNTPDQASLLRPGVAETRTLDFAGDEDWLVFDALAGNTVTLEVQTAKPGTSLQIDIVGGAGSSLAAWTNRTKALEWSPTASGRYYIRARNNLGRLDSLEYSLRLCSSTSVSLTGPSTVAYGAQAKLSGSIAGTAGVLPGRTVTLESSLDGVTWSHVASATSDAAGRFSFEVTPTRLTRYAARYSGDSQCPSSGSPVLRVAPATQLTRPQARLAPRRARAVTFFGYLRPGHPAGGKAAQLYFYHREGDKWVLRRTADAKASDYLGYSKYSAPVALPYSGAWRVRAFHSDATHAPTFSSWSEISVR